jgi:hypothetical protein
VWCGELAGGTLTSSCEPACASLSTEVLTFGWVFRERVVVCGGECVGALLGPEGTGRRFFRIVLSGLVAFGSAGLRIWRGWSGSGVAGLWFDPGGHQTAVVLILWSRVDSVGLGWL